MPESSGIDRLGFAGLNWVVRTIQLQRLNFSIWKSQRIEVAKERHRWLERCWVWSDSC